MLMLALMQVVVQCIIEYEYGTMQGGRASLWRLVPPTDMKAEEVDEATPKMLTRISKWQKG